LGRFQRTAGRPEGGYDRGLAPGGALSGACSCGPPEPPTEVETQAVIELATRHYEELFDGLRRQAQERNVTLETYVLVGHPADQILKAAARYGADMIVVGHRGRSAIRDWVSGSTSRRVFTHATCPVLVVRAR